MSLKPPSTQQLKTLTSSILRNCSLLAENPSQSIAVDASWHMPSANRDAYKEYLSLRIPKARFFDLDQIADTKTCLPHMLPSEQEFNRHMGRLGISESDDVVVYDSVGIFSSCRAYWTFLVFGHKRVSILDGGLPAWIAGNLATESNMAPSFLPKGYKAVLQPHLVASYQDILDISEGGNPSKAQLVDARPAGRFSGKDPEPRPEIPSGSIKGSINIPFKSVLDPQGRHFLSPSELATLFAQKQLDLSKPIVASCGSGVTACVLFTALKLCGAENVAVYDGSWTEYAQRKILNMSPESLVRQ